MRPSSAVGVHDNLPAGESGVAVRASDHELACRIDVKDEIGVEQCGSLLRQPFNDFRQEYCPDVILDLVVHRLVRPFLAVLPYGIGVTHFPEFRCGEFVVLGRDYDGVDANRPVGLVVLDGELGLGVRPEIRHEIAAPVADFRKHFQGQMRKIERKRHILLSVPAGVSEHHSLVAGALLLRVGADHAPVDVGTLLVDGREDSAGVAVEHVCRLVVADLVDDLAHLCLDVDICVLGPDFAADHHQAGAAECLAGDFGFRVLPEEFVEDCVRNLVGHLVRMSFRY